MVFCCRGKVSTVSASGKDILQHHLKGEEIMAPEGSIKVQKVDDYRWKILREGKMRTEGLIYADESLFADIRKDQSLAQVANVAWLPGIVGRSLAMPDIHWGYGFPIGGVAAFDPDNGIVSPGGVGYDIN
jgi:tRNA-splicing ligase RtcB